MEKALLKEIILEQQKEIEKKSRGVERTELSQVKKYFKLPHTVIIAGIRRTGKSTLLLQIIDKFYKNNCYYFNFEDERLLDFQVEDFMTKGTVSFNEEDSIIDIAECFIKNNFRRVAITSGGKLAGIVSRKDIIKTILHLRHKDKSKD